MSTKPLSERIKTWAPKNTKMTLDEHQAKLSHIGDPGSKFMYFNPVVTFGGAFGIWAVIIGSLINPVQTGAQFQVAQAWVTDVWNWLYMFSQNVWIAVLLYCLVAFYNLKLGKDDEEPEFADGPYFAMLFSAGVATGLWYFTAEAMWHYEGYGTPRWMDTSMFNMNSRAEHAIGVTYFHWGLHGWIPYSAIGAVLALLHYRRDFPLSMRWCIYPLVGDMVYGILGDMVEILSIICTIFGVCTSLGLGAFQILKGMQRLDRATYRGVDYIEGGNLGIEYSKANLFVIILAITLMATTSVVVGLKGGIQVLSSIAFALSLFILASIVFMDETWYIFNANNSAMGYYLWFLPKVSFHTDAWEELGMSTEGRGGAPDDEGGAAGWMNGWTIFYWGWWISWGPFVGTFLARISRGRKLGTYIIATLVLPSIWSFAFTGIFGAAQIRISNQAISATQHCVSQLPPESGITVDSPCYITGYCEGCSFTFGSTADKTKFGWMQEADGQKVWQPVPDSVTRLYNLATEDVLFEHLQTYGSHGWSTFLSVLTLICIVLYFVTSSDSASFVVDMMAANGLPEPPLAQKIFWAITEGVAAAVLTMAAPVDDPKQGLNAVKALPIILGLPYTFLLFYCCQSLIIICKEETQKLEMNRKNFTHFLLFNLEPMSLLSFVFPAYPAAVIATKTMGSNLILNCVGFTFLWLLFIVLAFCTLTDVAFSSMALAAYFMFGSVVGFLRVSTRTRLGITGDMITDMVACNFWLPFAVGQMYAEDHTAVAPPKDTGKGGQVIGAERNQVDI